MLPVTKGLGAVAVPILVFAFGRNDPVQWVMAGYARRRRIPWSAIERVRLDRRDRLGITSELLEIDADDALFLFSMHDLGAEPEEVLASLQALRSARPSGTPPAR